MAHEKISMGLAVILASLIFAATGTAAQSSDCTNVLISMSPCLSYISGNSSRPPAACCTQLGTVVRSQPQCLCQVLNGGGSNLGIEINQTQALALPSACNVQTPSISQCDVASPSGSPNASPNSPNTNSEGGSRTIPTGDGSSDAISTKFNVSMLFSLLLVASYVSIFNI